MLLSIVSIVDLFIMRPQIGQYCCHC
jgi:hypothetical protein